MVACVITPFLSILIHIFWWTHIFFSVGFHLGMGLLGHMVQHFPKASTICFTSPNTFFLLILFPCLTSTIIAMLLQYEKSFPLLCFSLQRTRSLLLLPLLFILICVCVCVCMWWCGLVTESCPTLVTTMDRRAWQATVHGILQARILEWVAISFSRGSSWPRKWTGVSCIVGGFFINWTTREAHKYNKKK